jgi:hypothetical protein
MIKRNFDDSAGPKSEGFVVEVMAGETGGKVRHLRHVRHAGDAAG